MSKFIIVPAILIGFLAISKIAQASPWDPGGWETETEKDTNSGDRNLAQPDENLE